METPAPGGFSIRKAVTGDLPALLSLPVPELPPWDEGRFLFEINGERSVFAVAESGGTLLGYSLAWVVVDEMDIHRVAVSRHARRNGTGTALVRAMIGMAPGAARIMLEVADSNAPAVALYRSLGFRESGRRRGYYDGGDAILMEMENDV